MVSAVAEKQDVSTSNSADEDIKLVKGTSKKGLGGNGFLVYYLIFQHHLQVITAPISLAAANPFIASFRLRVAW